MKTFNEWEINEAVAIVEDELVIRINTMDTWSNVSTTIRKTRGTISATSSYQLQSSKWYKDRKLIIDNLEEICKLLVKVLYDSERKVEKVSVVVSSKNHKYIGTRFETENSHTTRELKDSLFTGFSHKMKFGTLGNRLKKVFEESTKKKWYHNDGFVLFYKGNVEQLEIVSKKLLDNLKEEFRGTIYGTKYNI